MTTKKAQVPLELRGTGNILKDLISCSIPLPRVQDTNDKQTPTTSQGEGQASRPSSCSLCASHGNCSPLTLDEIRILDQLNLSSFTISDCLCVSCSSILRRLTKLRKEIDDIILCLRAVARIKGKRKGNDKSRPRVKPKDRPKIKPKSKEITARPQIAVDFEDGTNLDIKLEPIDQEGDDFNNFDMDFMDDQESEVNLDLATFVQTSWEGHDPLEDVDKAKELDVNQIRGKRKSRVKAEQLLRLVAQSDNDAQEGDDKGGRDSNYEGESEPDVKQDVVRPRKRRRRKRAPLFKQETDGPMMKIKRKRAPKIKPDIDGPRKLTKTKWTPLDPLECAVCGEKSNDTEELESHKSQHSINKCDVCEVSFKTDVGFRIHLLSPMHNLGKRAKKKDEDGDQPVFICPECSTPFNSVKALSNHSQAAHKINAAHRYCEPCNMQFKFRQTYLCHLLTDRHALISGGEKAVAELEEQKQFQCEICQRKFITALRLRQHILWVHERKKRPGLRESHVCDICGKTMATIYSLQYHVTHSHSGQPKRPHRKHWDIPLEEKRYGCKECGIRYADRKGLYSHLKRKHEGVRYKCEICDKEFTTPAGVRAHKGTAHGDAAGLELVAQNKANKDFSKESKNKVAQCLFCSNSIKGNAGMAKHVELFHLSEKTTCPFGCEDMIENETQWLEHMAQCKSEKMTQAQGPSSFCLVCRDPFPNVFLKIIHHLRLHTVYPCIYCGQNFTTEDTLTRHSARHKGLAERFLCTHCGKRFNRAEGLKVHSRTCPIETRTPEEMAAEKAKRDARRAKQKMEKKARQESELMNLLPEANEYRN